MQLLSIYLLMMAPRIKHVIGVLYNNQLYGIYETIYFTNVDTLNGDQTNGINKKEQIMLFNAKRKNNTLVILKIIKENTNKNDEIYVHRGAGNLYLLSNRLSSVKYFNLPAVDLNENRMIGEDFLKEIINSETKLIVLSSSFYHSKKVGIDLSFYEFVSENYNLIYDGNEHYVYLKKQ